MRGKIIHEALSPYKAERFVKGENGRCPVSTPSVGKIHEDILSQLQLPLPPRLLAGFHLCRLLLLQQPEKHHTHPSPCPPGLEKALLTTPRGRDQQPYRPMTSTLSSSQKIAFNYQNILFYYDMDTLGFAISHINWDLSHTCPLLFFFSHIKERKYGEKLL